MSAGLPMHHSIGPYRVIDFIGAGGMGTVYRVAHRSTGQVAAAKVLSTLAAPRALDRFRNEARILQALAHPAIARMHEFLEVDGAPCLVMEYVDGDTLEQIIRSRGPLPIADAVRIFAALADAVSYIHQRGIVHRDLKSNNVKVDTLGAVKLLDFGIATAEATPRLTSTGNVVGTLMSLAPEQLRTGRAEPRSDIWALGILFYEMLTARLPFEGGADGFVGEKILRGAYSPASERRSGLSREIDRIIGRCLRVRIEDRYASAESLLTDLRALQSAEKPLGQHSVLGALGEHELLRTSSMVATSIARQWRLVLSAGLTVAAISFLAWSLRPLTPESSSTVIGGTSASTFHPASRSSDDLSIVPPPSHPENGTPDVNPSVSRRSLIIRVLEGAADVYIDDMHVGTTPYTWRAAVGTEVELTLRRAGCDDLRRPLRLEEGMQETVESLRGCRRP